MAWNLAAEGNASSDEAELALSAEIAAVLAKPQYGASGSSMHGEVVSADPLHALQDAAATAGVEPVAPAA